MIPKRDRIIEVYQELRVLYPELPETAIFVKVSQQVAREYQQATDAHYVQMVIAEEQEEK